MAVPLLRSVSFGGQAIRPVRRSFSEGGSSEGAKNGGPDQVRTDDLLNAIEALFQLSYEPITTARG